MSAGATQAPIPWTPAPPQLVMAYSVCRGVTRSAAKNFYYAFLVLPRRKREALCAVYAFMRRCDDIADEAAVPMADRRARLPVRGAAAVARQVLSRGAPFAPLARPALVNGAAGAVVAPRGRVFAVIGFTVARGHIVEIDVVADPEKLRGLTVGE